MYNERWDLKENPFSLSPDPAFFYRSQQHEQALANLIYGIESRKGFLALTGEVGTGKTTVLECLRDYLRERYIGYITVANSRLSVQEFFEVIAYDLRCGRSSKPEVLFTLNQLLVQEAEAGRTTVLIVDEAQNLERDVLEEIRLLGNLEDRYGKLLQVVLAGQPELDRKLDAPDLRQFKQRIVVRCCLRPFTNKETAEYIASRLEHAGMPRQAVFPPEVLEEVHRLAKGVPRLINAICDNLLVMTSTLGEPEAAKEMLAKVSDELRLDGSSRSSPRDSNDNSSPQRVSHPAGPVATAAENASMAGQTAELVARTHRSPHPGATITPVVAPSVARQRAPSRTRRAVRFAWIAAAVAALGGLTLVAGNGLWRIRQFMPGVWAQPIMAEPAQPQLPSSAPSAGPTPEIKTPPPAPPPARPYQRGKVDPPPVRKPLELLPARVPELPSIPMPPPAPMVAPNPSIALATVSRPIIQNEPAPRRDPEQVVDSRPASPVTPPTPASAPSRFIGAWTYPSNGVFYGSEPQFVELAIREDKGHLMGGLSARFKTAPGPGRELLQFGFGGDLRNASIQTFGFETRSGDKGTIELIPGATPNTLEVNFHTRLNDGKTQSGNMILVKRTASSL
jgi:general secretion pathway protein A